MHDVCAVFAATSCRVLPRVAMCCNVLPCVASCEGDGAVGCTVLRFIKSSFKTGCYMAVTHHIVLVVKYTRRSCALPSCWGLLIFSANITQKQKFSVE